MKRSLVSLVATWATLLSFSAQAACSHIGLYFATMSTATATVTSITGGQPENFAPAILNDTSSAFTASGVTQTVGIAAQQTHILTGATTLAEAARAASVNLALMRQRDNVLHGPSNVYTGADVVIVVTEFAGPEKTYVVEECTRSGRLAVIAIKASAAWNQPSLVTAAIARVRCAKQPHVWRMATGDRVTNCTSMATLEDVPVPAGITVPAAQCWLDSSANCYSTGAAALRARIPETPTCTYSMESESPPLFWKGYRTCNPNNPPNPSGWYGADRSTIDRTFTCNNLSSPLRLSSASGTYTSGQFVGAPIGDSTHNSVGLMNSHSAGTECLRDDPVVPKLLVGRKIV